MIIRLRDGQDVDLSKLSRNELLELKVKVETESDRVKQKIYEIKAKAAAEGIYDDTERFRRLGVAQRVLARQTQTIALALSQLKSQLKSERSAEAPSMEERAEKNATREHKSISIQHAFVGIARTVLPQELFNQILSAAKVAVDQQNADSDKRGCRQPEESDE